MFLGSCIDTKSTRFTKPKLSLQSLHYIPVYLTLSQSNSFDISCNCILIWLFRFTRSQLNLVFITLLLYFDPSDYELVRI